MNENALSSPYVRCTVRVHCIYMYHVHVYVHTCTCIVEQDGLGVSSYGISVTTMEEVFMKVREGEEETLKERSTSKCCVSFLSVRCDSIIHVLVVPAG